MSARHMVVPAALLPVNQNPEESEAQGTCRKTSGHQAYQRLFPAYAASIVTAYQSQAPGAHAQGLTTVCPESGKKEARDQRDRDAQGVNQPQRPIGLGQPTAA